MCSAVNLPAYPHGQPATIAGRVSSQWLAFRGRGRPFLFGLRRRSPRSPRMPAGRERTRALLALGGFGVIGPRLDLPHARMARARNCRLQVLQPSGHCWGVCPPHCIGPLRRDSCKHRTRAGQRTDLPSYRAVDRASVHGGLAGGLRVYALDTPGILLPGVSTPDATGAFRPHPRCRGVRKQSDSLRGSQDRGPSGSKVAVPNTTLIRGRRWPQNKAHVKGCGRRNGYANMDR